MKKKEIKEILKIVLDSIKGKRFRWRLEGSANLTILGVKTKIQDIDITTDDKGIEIFRERLKKYVVKDFFSKKNKRKFCEAGYSQIEQVKNEIESYHKSDSFEWKTE
ncbi:hypothetical protein GF361_00125 [Candidatus Woesearchaeota archaeon]|nr:hypothetical protein [Candidatus Woesearchaeota archaeon]